MELGLRKGVIMVTYRSLLGRFEVFACVSISSGPGLAR